MRVLVINLDKDVARWKSVSADLSTHSWLKVDRIRAVYGPDLPSLAAQTLAGHNAALKMRGTLGTFLSHVKAWEAIAISSEPLSVVLEDDALLLGFERISSLAVPADADLVFLNDRMSPGSRHERPPSPTVECLSILMSLRKLKAVTHGVGGDGYILSATGAVKLLRAVQTDRFFGHVDWRLLRYSLAPEDLGPEFRDSRLEYVIRNHHNPILAPAWNVVKAYCVSSPLVAFGVSAASSRDAADALGVER